MTDPFIFIATNRLKPGKLDDEKKRVPDRVDFIQANEPQLIAFNEYANEDGTEVAVVQVHRDSDSMAFHMEFIAERAASAYADTIDATTSVQVFGTPSNAAPRCFDARRAPASRYTSSPTTSAASPADRERPLHVGVHVAVVAVGARR